MNHILFFTFNVVSAGFCVLATWATLRYLAKHQMAPKTRYMPFGFLRTRHVAFFYIMGIFGITVYSVAGGIYYLIT